LTGIFFIGHSLSGKSTLLNAAAEDKRILFNGLLAADGTQLHTFVDEYSYWDDLVRFINTRDRRWPAAAFDNCLATYGLDMISIYDTEPAVVHSLYSDAADPSIQPIAAHSLPRLFQKDHFCHFYVNTPRGVMEVMGATVHPTSDVDRITSPHGYLLAGRLLNDALLARLARSWGKRIDLLPPSRLSTEDRLEEKDGTIIFTQTLRDANENPVVQIVTSASSAVCARLDSFTNMQFILAALFLIFVLALVSLTLSLLSPSSPAPSGLHDDRDLAVPGPQIRTSATAEMAGEPDVTGKLLMKFLTMHSRIIKRASSRNLDERALVLERDQLENRIRRRIVELDNLRNACPLPRVVQLPEMRASKPAAAKYRGPERRKKLRTKHVTPLPRADELAAAAAQSPSPVTGAPAAPGTAETDMPSIQHFCALRLYDRHSTLSQ
jgi:hypothetical protein